MSQEKKKEIKDNAYERANSGLDDEYFHYQCVDCGFEDDVMDVACGADHEGGPWDLDCYKCGGTFKYTPTP